MNRRLSYCTLLQGAWPHNQYSINKHAHVQVCFLLLFLFFNHLIHLFLFFNHLICRGEEKTVYAVLYCVHAAGLCLQRERTRERGEERIKEIRGKEGRSKSTCKSLNSQHTS